MNTFWLKLAGIAVVIVGVIILISVLSPSESKPQSEPAKPKTVQGMWQQDEKRLRAEPNVPPPVEANQQPAEQQKQVEPQFTELLPEQQAEAERLFEWAIAQRKMGRLPGMGGTSFSQMVDACRQIIQKFPGSEFDYKARRMLAEVPSRFRKNLEITDEELDLSGFFK
jgi:type IV secretory pathway VirB10-like protein